MENINKFIKFIGAVLVIGLVAFLFFRSKDSKEEMSTTTPTPDSSVPAASELPPSDSPAVQRKYKDGTYSAQGGYRSPAQDETMSIELVIENDAVSKATFFENPSNPTTAKMQGQFKAGFEQFVVGKNIDEINLTVVNGSSLTPKGFMDALAKIKVQAQS